MSEAYPLATAEGVSPRPGAVPTTLVEDQALARHATTALLNTASSGVDYLYSENQVVALLQDAYQSGDFERTKNRLEAENETRCPLN